MDRDSKLIFEALQQKTVAGPQTYIYLDLYTGKASVLPKGDFEEATRGLEVVKGKITVYRGEEYMVLAIPAVRAENEEAPINWDQHADKLEELNNDAQLLQLAKTTGLRGPALANKLKTLPQIQQIAQKHGLTVSQMHSYLDYSFS